jgi:hypothetical protein
MAVVLSQNEETEFDEFCPECGEWKHVISDTGWCLPCTRRYYPDRCYCENCGKQFSGRGQLRRLCQPCEGINWQARNADKIERYIGIGLTYELARARVAYENRPTCNSCGRKIKRGTHGRHLFCHETPECRKAARRYKWYKENRGMNREQALNAVILSLQ